MRYPIVAFGQFSVELFWVSFQWEDVNVHQYREWGSSYGSILGVKNGLLSSQNCHFWKVILDISE
ncbi:MAG: hypothetical protein WBG51_06925, partial [Syntrophobacteria bacterium]